MRRSLASWTPVILVAIVFGSIGLATNSAQGQTPSPSPTPTPSGCVWDPDCGSLVPAEPSPSPTPTPTTPEAELTPPPEETSDPAPGDEPKTTPGGRPTKEPNNPDKPDADGKPSPGASDEYVGSPSPGPDGWSTEIPDGYGAPSNAFPEGFSSTDPPFAVLPGPRSTAAVLKVLEGKGVAAEKGSRILAPFPVFGPAVYSNDWHAARHTPSFHLHQGTDIFAARGTPVIASASGAITRVTPTSSVGGTSLWITSKEGTGFYYAHLDAIAEGVLVGTRVRPGDLVGYVGSTGNAAGGRPHLHFEIHPKMGEAIPPVPHLDGWLHSALIDANALPGGKTPTKLGNPALVAGWIPAPPVDIGLTDAVSVLPAAERQPEASRAGSWPTLLSVAIPLGVVVRPRRRYDRRWAAEGPPRTRWIKSRSFNPGSSSPGSSSPGSFSPGSFRRMR